MCEIANNRLGAWRKAGVKSRRFEEGDRCRVRFWNGIMVAASFLRSFELPFIPFLRLSEASSACPEHTNYVQMHGGVVVAGLAFLAVFGELAG